MDETTVKKKDRKLLSETRKELIKVSSYNLEIIFNEKNVSPLFFMHKYIYLKKPLSLFLQNNFDSIEPQTLECFMMSTENKSKSFQDDTKIKEINDPVSCTTKYTERKVQESSNVIIPASCQKNVSIETASTNNKNTSETDINFRQPFTQANLSQGEETQNWILNSNELIQDIFQNNLCDVMKKCITNQSIILSNATSLTPSAVVIGEGENTRHFVDSIQQSKRKESLVCVCQENIEQLQERKLQNLQGHTLTLSGNNNITTHTQDLGIKSTCQSVNVKDFQRNSNYCTSEISKGETFGSSSSDEENVNSKEESRIVTEEYLLDKCDNRDTSQNQNKDVKLDIKNTNNYSKEYGDMDLHNRPMGIFPNTSLQYSVLKLKEVYANLLDIKKILIQSETSVKGTIIQYIDDKKLEQQLLKIMEKHSQNQIKCEQKLQSVVNHLIEEQIQIIKSLKESSQTHIEMLINQKNMMEQENLFLLKKFEELHVLNQFHDSETYTPDKNYILLENNEKLRNRLNFAQHSICELQTEHQEMLQQLEQCANEMHKQKLEIETQKILQIRNENDFKIEKTHLLNELEKYKKCIEDSTDFAHIIIEDMKYFINSFEDSERRVSVKYEQLKVEDTSVVNVMSMCHSFICDLGLKVVNTLQELTAKDKEIHTIKEGYEKMQNVFNELETEYNMLQQQSECVMSEKIDIEEQLMKKTEEISDLKDQISKYEQNKFLLEMEINGLQELKTAAKEQEVLKLQLENCIAELKKNKEDRVQKLLSDEKSNKSMEVDLMKMTALLDMYETQNKELIIAKHDLQEQMENMKVSFLNLQNLSDRYEELEKSYCKEIAEKDSINQQLKNMQVQLSEYSVATSKHKKQIQNLEMEQNKISKENLEMKWKLNNLENINQRLEHDNSDMLLRLEEESSKHKSQMNKSHSRIQELQNLIKTQEKEITELKNMFLIQTETIYSLQQDCEEKQNIIIKLETNCDNLNILHQKDENEILILNNKTKELENQITAVNSSNKSTLNSIKYEFEALETTLKITQDDLNNSVIKLQEKETNLTSIKESLQTAEHRLVEKEHQTADSLRTIEMLQNQLQDVNEIKSKYAEMQDLLEILESTIKERDTLKEDVTTLQVEIVSLQTDFKELQNKNNTLIKYCTLQKEHIKGMKAQINKLREYLSKVDFRNRENIATDLHQVTYDMTLHNNKAADLEYEIEEYKFILEEKQNGSEEKCRLQSQVMLLHELHKRNSNDLIQARRTIEMQEDKITKLINQINECDNEKRKTERELEVMSEQHTLFQAEIESLQDRMKEETQNCLSLTEEYFNYKKEMSEKEENFLKKVRELNNQIEILNEKFKEADNEKEHLTQALENKKKEESLLKIKNEEMESQLFNYEQTLNNLVQEKRKNKQLENQLKVSPEEGHSLVLLQQLLQKQHADVTNALEDSREDLKKTREALNTLEQLEREHAIELQNMKEKILKENSECLEEFKCMEDEGFQSEQAIKKLMESQECLLRHKKHLSLKLLKALKIIYQAKLKYKLANEKIQELSSQSTSTLINKQGLKEEALILNSKIGGLNKKVKKRNIESENQSYVQKWQKHINRLEQQVDELQLQLLKAKQKVQKENFKTEALLLVKEDIILQSKEQITLLQEKTNRICKRLAEAQSKILQQNQEQSKLKHDVVKLQVEKRELSLQLKETEGNLNEEKQRRIHLESTYHELLQKLNSDLKPK